MDIRRLDLNLLVVFDTVYRTRNLTAAGGALALSQPAMSHALRRLRDALKDPVFVRLRRGLEPTPFADQLASPVAHALGELRRALDKSQFAPSISTRTFRIAMTDIGEQVFLPSLGRYFGTVAPRASLQTSQIPVKDLREAMADGQVDIAMGFIPQLGAGFCQQLLFKDHYVCMARNRHPHISAPLTLEKYRRASHAVVSSEGTGHGEVIERVLQAKQVGARVSLRVSHFVTVPTIVARTDLAVVLPWNLARSFQFLKVKLFPLPFDLPDFDINQYWHERYHFDPAGQWLRKSVAELFMR